MSAFAHDTFTGAAGPLSAHVGEVGATWNTQNGSFGPNAVLNGAGSLIVGGPTTLEMGASGVPPATDYAVQATYTVNGVLGYGELYLIAGYIDTGTTRYWVRCLFASDKTVYADISLPSATISSHDFGAVGPDDGTHVARIEVQGHVLRVYIDGAQIGTDFAFGGAGLAATGAGQAGIRMYDVQYPDPPVVAVSEFLAESITTSGGPGTNWVLDTFTGGDGTLITAHTGEVGATWAENLGFWDANAFRLGGNRLGRTLYPTVGSLSGALCFPSGRLPAGTTAYTVEMAVTLDSNADHASVELWHKADSGSPQVVLAFQNTHYSGAGHELYLATGSGYPEAAFTQSYGTEYVIKLRVTGTLIEYLIDDVVKITATRTQPLVEPFGLMLYDHSGFGYPHVNYFKLYSPGGGGGFWTDFDLTREILPGGLVVAASKPPLSPVYEPPAPPPRIKVQPPEPTPAPRTSTVLSDTFTGSGLVTAHLSDSGHTWTDVSVVNWANNGNAGEAVNLTLASGAVITVQPTGSANPSVAANASIPADCFVEAHLVGSSVGSSFVGFMWRFNPATGDGYYLGINGGGSGSIEVFIYGFIDGGDDGEFYPNSGTYTLPVTNANDFVLRIEMVGSAITVKLDGVSVHSETATLITAAGRVGFWLSSFGTGHSGDATISEFTAGELTSSGGGGGGGGPTVFFRDEFTGSGSLASHTPDVGDGWSATPNDFAGDITYGHVGSGAVGYVGGYAQFDAIALCTPPSGDYYVEAECIWTDRYVTIRLGARWNPTSGGDGLFISIDPEHTPEVSNNLYLTVESYLGTPGFGFGTEPFAVANKLHCTVRLEVEGTAYRVFFDGVLVNSGPDAALGIGPCPVTGIGKPFLSISGYADFDAVVARFEAGTLGGGGSFWTDFDLTRETLP